MKEWIFPSCSLCRNFRISLGIASLIVIGTYVVLLIGMDRQG
jgi:hypothetical protein